MAAGNTYTPIQTYTLASNGTVTFSSIPSTYTDLVIIGLVGHASTSGISVGVQFNGDTGTTYSNTYMSGTGTSKLTGKLTGRSWNYIGWNVCPDITNITNTFVFNVFSYANTSIYKTTLSQNNLANGTYPGVEELVGLWRNTAAINSIKVAPDNGNFIAGSIVTLYGITAA